MACQRPVLVTGANGFIGSHLVEALLDRGVPVRALVRRTSRLSHLPEGAEVVFGDVGRPSSLAAAAEGVSAVYHVAGTIASFRPKTFFEVNARGTRNLVLACRKAAPELDRFVLISSVAAGGPSRDGRPRRESDRPLPVSVYGASKLRGEREAFDAAGDLPVTIVRPPVVYGPRDTGVLEFFRMAVRGVFPRFPREKYYSLCHVRDLVRGILLAGEAEVPRGKIYHLADSRAFSLRGLLDGIAASLGVSPRRFPVPEPLLRLLGPISDAAAMSLGLSARPLADKVRELLPDYWVVDTTKAERELGFRTEVSLAEGLEETARFYVREGWLGVDAGGSP